MIFAFQNFWYTRTGFWVVKIRKTFSYRAADESDKEEVKQDYTDAWKADKEVWQKEFDAYCEKWGKPKPKRKKKKSRKGKSRVKKE